MAKPEDSDPFASWVTPAKALTRAMAVFKSRITAIDALGERIRDGLIGVAAKQFMTVPKDKPDSRSDNVPVPKAVWSFMQGGWTGQNFWQTGQVELWADRGNTRLSLHGLLFDPVGLDEYLEPFESATETPIAGGFKGRTIPSPNKGKAVSASALKIWAEAFAKIHKGDNDINQSIALQSGEGMFPDRFVSRDRIVSALKDAGVTFRRGPKKQISGE